MKRCKKYSHISVIIILIFCISNIHSWAKTNYHPVTFGVKLGGSWDNIYGDGWNNDYKMGYSAGLFLEKRGRTLGIQAEATFATGRYGFFSGVPDVKNHYINLPLLLELKLLPKVYLQFGPQYSVLASSEFADGRSSSIFSDGGFLGVVGCQFWLSRSFFAGGRYLFSMSNWNAVSSENQWKPRSWQAYVGLRIF